MQVASQGWGSGGKGCLDVRIVVHKDRDTADVRQIPRHTPHDVLPMQPILAHGVQHLRAAADRAWSAIVREIVREIVGEIVREIVQEIVG